ncbi:hypothetical protein LTR50_007270 [Elasticomyces elasticus]|nr:hypothetical protein LTR50_007270 [Elasticomyces elasticus]
MQKSRSTGLLGNGRLKVALVAMTCMMLAYMMTTSFRPGESSPPDVDAHAHEAVGVLRVPPTVGATADWSSSDAKVEKAAQMASSGGSTDRNQTGPSISGALSDLHHAVTDKLSSWKPWSSRPSTPDNTTFSGVCPEVCSCNASSNSYGTSDERIEPDRQDLGEKPRVGKCTVVFGGGSAQATYERAIRTHETHDRIHGYRLHVLRHAILDDVWSKPAYILSLLLQELAKSESERLEWLFWVDGDTIMLNPYIPIETFLPPSPEFDDIHLLVSNDWNGLNNGVFPIRVTQWSVELFSAIVAFRHYRPMENLVFRDQSAMEVLLQDDRFSEHKLRTPQRWFNAYQGEANETLEPYQVRRGDFLVHFAGVGDRDDRMRYWLDRAEQHLPEWEMDVQHTSYPTEVKEFWSEKTKERELRKAEIAETRKNAQEALLDLDEKMNDFEDRIKDDVRRKIRDKEFEVRKLVEDETTQKNVGKLRQALSLLDETALPLKEAVGKANKELMKEAHDVIFAAERHFLVGHEGVDTELSALEEKISKLKTLVMQAYWHRVDVRSAIDQARVAQEKLQSKLADLEKKLQTEAEEKKKELDEYNAQKKEEELKLLKAEQG